MAFSNIAEFIKPEFPKESGSESSAGNLWEYIGPTDIIRGNKPKIGEIWADGRTVTSYELVPSIDNSAVSELTVSTVTSESGGGGTIGETELQEVRYQLRWLPQSLPLLQHPEFRTAEATFLRDVYGWENELSEVNKANFEYYPRDENGNPTGSLVTIPSGTAAYKYVTLRSLGYENYNFFAPSWSKIGTYRGTNAPGTGSIGQKETPDGPGFPEGWEWVKTDDSAEREGRSNTWQRTETWTGARTVDYDVDQIFAGVAP